MSTSPECIQPLREEVESIVKEQGWTKESLFNMRKLDSFLRETQRCDSFSGEDWWALDSHSCVLTLYQLPCDGKP